MKKIQNVLENEKRLQIMFVLSSTLQYQWKIWILKKKFSHNKKNKKEDNDKDDDLIYLVIATIIINIITKAKYYGY